jgi:hypothetical protein
VECISGPALSLSLSLFPFRSRRDEASPASECASRQTPLHKLDLEKERERERERELIRNADRPWRRAGAGLRSPCNRARPAACMHQERNARKYVGRLERRIRREQAAHTSTTWPEKAGD